MPPAAGPCALPRPGARRPRPDLSRVQKRRVSRGDAELRRVPPGLSAAPASSGEILRPAGAGCTTGGGWQILNASRSTLHVPPPVPMLAVTTFPLPEAAVAL